MIHDALLRFATNQRPPQSAGPIGPVLYPLPTGGGLLGGTMLAFDMKVAMDRGSGYPLIARFDIKTSFTTADNSQTVRFAAALTNDPDNGAVDTLPLIASGTLTATAGVYPALVAGASYELVLPKLSTLAVQPTRRYLILGMEVNSPALAPAAALFTAGGLDAYILIDGESEMIRYPGGFSV